MMMVPLGAFPNKSPWSCVAALWCLVSIPYTGGRNPYTAVIRASTGPNQWVWVSTDRAPGRLVMPPVWLGLDPCQGKQDQDNESPRIPPLAKRAKRFKQRLNNYAKYINILGTSNFGCPMEIPKHCRAGTGSLDTPWMVLVYHLPNCQIHPNPSFHVIMVYRCVIILEQERPWKTPQRLLGQAKSHQTTWARNLPPIEIPYCTRWEAPTPTIRATLGEAIPFLGSVRAAWAMPSGCLAGTIQ